MRRPGSRGILDAQPLQRAEVVGVPELGAECFEDRPVTQLTLDANGARQGRLEVGDNAIVVEQRVVDIEKKDRSGECERR